MTTTKITVAATLLVLGVGGVGYAAGSTHSDGTITACAATKSGTYRHVKFAKGDLRLARTAAKCRSYEKPVTWAQAGVPGAQGPAGPQGPQGEPGEPGAGGASGYEVVYQEYPDIPTPVVNTQFGVACPAGKKAVGGGAVAEVRTATAFVGPAWIPYDIPDPYGAGWIAAVNQAGDGSTHVDVSVHAVCVTSP